MRPRLRRQNLVVWNMSAGPVGRHGVPGFTRLGRSRRIRSRIRIAALFAAIGLMRLARAVRTRRGATFLLAGTVLTVAGIILPSGVAVISGMLVMLRGVAVILGVSEPHRPLGGAPAGRPDYFGFGTPVYRAGYGMCPRQRPRRADRSR